MPFTVTMPKLSPTMTEGIIAAWHKKPGDFVQAGDVLLEIATDKATVEHEALDEGYLRKILCEEGANIQVNAPLAVFTESADERIEGFAAEKEEPKKTPPDAIKPKEEKPRVEPALAQGARLIASPLAKKLAKKQGIDLSIVSGSGPRGRIMSRDLEVEAPVKAIAKEPAATQEEKLSPMRQVIAKRLQESKQTIPHFYVSQEVDVGEILRMRQSLKEQGASFTINDFIIKACAVALAKHWQVNSGFNEAKQACIRYSQVDISLAVTIEGGLITPILFDAASKSLKTLSQEAKTLATKAREGKLQIHEYQGGSFTLSNLGMFGITEMYPIINPPQGAILGVGAAQDAVMVKNGQCVAGKKMVLTLSCDHRIIDGTIAAQFMQTLRKLLENPLLFLTQ